MTRDDLIAFGDLMVAAGYAEKTGVFRDALFVPDFTTLGRTRFRELFVRLGGVPKNDSHGRRTAVLRQMPELAPFDLTDGVLDVLLAICWDRGNNPYTPR